MSGFQYYLTLFTFFTGQGTDAFKSEKFFHTFVGYVTKQSRFFRLLNKPMTFAIYFYLEVLQKDGNLKKKIILN